MILEVFTEGNRIYHRVTDTTRENLQDLFSILRDAKLPKAVSKTVQDNQIYLQYKNVVISNTINNNVPPTVNMDTIYTRRRFVFRVRLVSNNPLRRDESIRETFFCDKIDTEYEALSMITNLTYLINKINNDGIKIKNRILL